MFASQGSRAPRAGRVVVRSLLAALGLMMGGAALVGMAPAHAQGPPQSRAVPAEDYLASFMPYYDGDFGRAQRAFQQSARSGVRSTEGRWVDSICYHTMIGESYYQLGDRAQALDQYTSALQLFLAYRDWLLRVQFPETIDEASSPQMANITWGRSTRISTIGRFPNTMLSAQGRLDNDQVIQRGGVIAPPQYFPLRVNEIVRCTALAIARRHEIMGPVCEHDPFTLQLLDALSRRPAPPNHWSQAWISVQLGLAYASANKPAEAAAELTKGLQVGGRFDHPLTPLALIELGKIAFAAGKFDAAAAMFYEATFPAVAFDQHDMLEEAFRWGNLTHIVNNQPGVYPPLVPAQAWARTKGSRVTQASLFLLAAEGLNNNGDIASAASMLDQAGRVMARREMQAGQIGARFHYETARLAFAQGKLAPGNTALAACMNFQKNGSRRLFQIALADKLYTTGVIRVDRIAEMLFDDVLRESRAADWTVDPMEAITVAMTPHLVPLEHWFEVAVKRKQTEKAAEIADRIRRHRFFSTTPTGGRLLALRWILEAPESILDDSARLQRRDLLAKYPRLVEFKNQAAAIQAEIDAQPREPVDDKAAKEQAERFNRLALVSAAQELLLSDIALRREPSDFVFPPPVTVKSVQQRLKPGQAILAYFTTTRYVVGFAMTSENCKMWQVSPSDTVKFKQDFALLLKAWGHTDRNVPLPTADLRRTDWKPIAARMFSALTNNAKGEHFDAIEELIVIPDGMLWYVPFEALQLEEKDGATVSLLAKTRLRYAPTMGLALPDGRTMPRPSRTMVVAGRMFPKEDESFAADAATELIDRLPGGFPVPRTPPAPGNLYATTFDRLVVLDDIEDADRGPYDWSPTRYDAGKPAGALAHWSTLPWAGPQQVVLPGYHTPVESGLKRGGGGDEVFLSVMGLMAGGSRTILLSRWRTGGQTGYDLAREFAQELPHTSAANAWQRAVELVATTELDLTREPRVRSTADESLTAEHPFFWAGYLLVDTGVEPAAE
jgi:tetratricopeptide (TPR) repeat protein